MSDITIVHKEHDGSTIETLRPENLSFTLNKGENGPHDISYEISRSALSGPDTVGPYRTDFELHLDTSGDDIVLIAGMHTMVSVSSDEEHAKFAGKDWLHYLERRFWPYRDSDPNFYRYGHPTSEDDPPEGFAYYVVGTHDSMEIITDFLNLALLLPNSLDLTFTLTNIGYEPEVFSVDLIDTESLLAKIQNLSQEESGEFDFWVEPVTKELVVVAPRQYDIDVVDDDSLAEHIFDTSNPGHEVFTVGWTNTGPTETRLIATGSNPSSTLAEVREYTPSSDVFRLLERNASFGDVFDRGRLAARARKELLFDLNPVHEVTLSVLPDTVEDFWTTFKPGKAIWIRADLEVHLIDAAFEIIAMDCNADSNGNMIVNFRLNQIYTPADLDA